LDGARENKVISTELLIYVYFSGQTGCSARNGGIREQQQVNGDVRRSTWTLILVITRVWSMDDADSVPPYYSVFRFLVVGQKNLTSYVAFVSDLAGHVSLRDKFFIIY
jgi:hypothetical protein